MTLLIMVLLLWLYVTVRDVWVIHCIMEKKDIQFVLLQGWEKKLKKKKIKKKRCYLKYRVPALEKVTSMERIKIWGWFCNLLIRDLLHPSCLCSSQLFRALFVFQKYNSTFTVAEKVCFLPGLEQKKNESLGTVQLLCWFEHQGRKIFRSKDFITYLLVVMFVFSSLCHHFFYFLKKFIASQVI